MSTSGGGCRLCPRECGADRSGGERGFCGCGKYPVVARAAAHFGEEPCISGTRGSGAIFFAGCPLHCCYCQNVSISRDDKITDPAKRESGGVFGARVDPSRLAGIMLRLSESGVHNINFVTGTPHVDTIIRAIDIAKMDGFKLPVVWNCSGYESIDTLRKLNGYVQIYLPDFKYSSSELAAKYSAAEDYPAVAKAAIEEMVRQTGRYFADDDGILRRGVIVRHLVLPEAQGSTASIDNTRGVLDFLARFPRHTLLVSLMGQYTPVCHGGGVYPELDRALTEDEYAAAVDYLEEAGIEDGFIQEPEASGEDEIPAFDGSGVIEL